nr:uncharacterized protein LOC110380166 [Helicoverpa armigera]
MYKYLANCSIMHRNAAVLTILCVLLCLTFNYTFPLHREGSNWSMEGYSNHSRICGRTNHHENILERSKKMASNLENAFKRFKDSTQDISRNIQAHLNTAVKNSLSEEDLRQYEQLVIMKKYPYLDLKEIESKFSSPSEKNTRQSVKYDSGTNYHGDPSFCEPLDDAPNVEITNRGLTGFAIPAKIVKTSKLLETKLKLNNIKSIDGGAAKQNVKLTSTPRPSESLRDDIMYYEENNLQ